MMSAARGDATCSASKAQRVSFDLNSTYKADEFRSTFSATFRYPSQILIFYVNRLCNVNCAIIATVISVAQEIATFFL